MTYFEKMNPHVKSEFDRYVSYISQLEGVLQIYLFGSYAYGEPSKYSDIDMLVVVRDDINALKIMQRIGRGLYDMKISLDVLAVRDNDFKELSAPDRATVQREAKEKGVLVYDS